MMNISTDSIRETVTEKILSATRAARNTSSENLSEKGQKLQALLDKKVFGCNNPYVGEALSIILGEKLVGRPEEDDHERNVLYKTDNGDGAVKGFAALTDGSSWIYSAEGRLPVLFDIVDEKTEVEDVKKYVNDMNADRLLKFFDSIVRAVVIPS